MIYAYYPQRHDKPDLISVGFVRQIHPNKHHKAFPLNITAKHTYNSPLRRVAPACVSIRAKSRVVWDCGAVGVSYKNRAKHTYNFTL
jgi:hypothetical protein